MVQLILNFPMDYNQPINIIHIINIFYIQYYRNLSIDLQYHLHYNILLYNLHQYPKVV